MSWSQNLLLRFCAEVYPGIQCSSDMILIAFLTPPYSYSTCAAPVSKPFNFNIFPFISSVCYIFISCCRNVKLLNIISLSRIMLSGLLNLMICFTPHNPLFPQHCDSIFLPCFNWFRYGLLSAFTLTCLQILYCNCVQNPLRCSFVAAGQPAVKCSAS
jgi:hypothetical protein